MRVHVKRTFITVDEEGAEDNFPRLQSEPAQLLNEFVPSDASLPKDYFDDAFAEIDADQSSFFQESSFVQPPAESTVRGEARFDVRPDFKRTTTIEQRGESDLPLEWQGKTSVMVRNLSYKCTPKKFQEELGHRGFKDLFDYVYVPVNFKGCTSKGYAFINFLDSHTAYRFYLVFNSTVMNIPGSKKLLQVIPSNLQGYDMNASHAELKQQTLDSTPAESTPQVPNEAFQTRQQGSNEHALPWATQSSKQPPMLQAHFAQAQQLPAPNYRPPPMRAESSGPMEQSPFQGSDQSPRVSGASDANQSSGCSQEGQTLSGTQSTTVDAIPRFCYSCGKSRLPYFSFCEWCGARFEAQR